MRARLTLFAFPIPDPITSNTIHHQQFCRRPPLEAAPLIQPRFSDSAACYVIQDKEGIEFRRIPYDFEATAAKIYSNPHLDNQLGDRLRGGR